MQLNSGHVGNVEFEDSKIIVFKNGIPGFEDLKRFVLLRENENDDGFFWWLQSVDRSDVAFIVVDLLELYPDYNPLVDKDVIESELGPYSPDDFIVYNIVNITEDSGVMVNLKAPVIINHALNRGMQIICDNEEYSLRHLLYK